MLRADIYIQTYIYVYICLYIHCKYPPLICSSSWVYGNHLLAHLSAHTHPVSPHFPHSPFFPPSPLNVSASCASRLVFRDFKNVLKGLTFGLKKCAETLRVAQTTHEILFRFYFVCCGSTLCCSSLLFGLKR